MVLDPHEEPAQQVPEILLALTILGEAEGEPYIGKIAVGRVAVNRSRRSGKSIADTVLAARQFDCWDPGTARRAFLDDTISDAATNVIRGVWEECLQAAEVAVDPVAADPTNGADHYVHESLWARDDGALAHPQWFSAQCIASGLTKEKARIGHHVFATTP